MERDIAINRRGKQELLQENGAGAGLVAADGGQPPVDGPSGHDPQAGFQAAASLREHGYQEPIVLVGDEGVAPYQRPPLSKAYLLGEMSGERLLLRPLSYYEKHAIELVLGDRVTSIDRAAGRVMMSSGAALPFDHLILALGARNRPLPVEGADLDGVHYLRSQKESDLIRARMDGAQNIVVVGAGFIGLEIAAVASKLGKQVTMLEALPRVMSRAVTRPVSDFYAQAHRDWGSELLLDARLARIDGAGGRVTGVTLADGRKHAADLVLAGIGIVPNVELAQAAGLAVAKRHRRRSPACHRRPAHFRHRRLRGVSRSGERRDDPAGVRCRMPPTRAARSRAASRGMRRITPRCPGSGATSATSNCRWSA